MEDNFKKVEVEETFGLGLIKSSLDFTILSREKCNKNFNFVNKSFYEQPFVL